MLFGREVRLTAASVLIALGCLFGPVEAGAGMCYSNNPDEIPPFITRGVDPNLLMIIDNSGSMYDLAYVADGGLCHDDTYSAVTGYAGYFAQDAWYAYDEGGDRFVDKSGTEAADMCAAADYRKTVGGEHHICLNTNSGVSFWAKGNFLNWAAASKLDIEKKILTGGKYDGTAAELVMESRGCLDRRFIRQTVLDSDGSHLTLAVRKPTRAEKADDDDRTSRIELYVTAEGYDYGACQQAVDEMQSSDGKLGPLKGYIDDCLDYPPGGSQDVETSILSAFNHSVQNCWYLNMQGEWAPGAGSVTRIKNDCEKLYEVIDPWEIEPDHTGYVCFGDHRRPETDPLLLRGYVGRCWDSGVTGDPVCNPKPCTDELETGNPRCIDGIVHQCDGNFNANKDQCLGSPGVWVAMEECTGGSFDPDQVGWFIDADIDEDACVDQGLRDYCNSLNFPEVVDPSDQVTGTGDDIGEFWNLPAMLVDSGVVGQLGQPLLVMKARLAQPEAPSGLLQEFAPDIRIGAMIFNRDGALSECFLEDPYVTYNCDDFDIRDGGRVIASIGKGEEHTQTLVDAINDIVADTWTPLSEAMYNAVGYFAQDEEFRLDPDDFNIYGGNEPITDWCQLNNVLLITDGAPTADQNQQMIAFAESLGYEPSGVTCAALHGSTYLRDLTQYAYEDIWRDRTFPEGEEWQTIATHVVAVGNFRDEGADLCSPDMLLQETASSGGTELYKAETLDQLETALREAFGKIRAGAAAGSAASVISATRSGEGAVYQAIFWPEKNDSAGRKIQWAGEVQALFVDDQGRFFEDTNGDRRLDADDLQVTIFFDPALNYSRACYGVIQGGACTGEVKDIAEVKYLWSANDWLSGLGDGEVLYNRASGQFTAGANQRHIFTWYDLNNDGVVDNTEVLAFEPEIIAGLGEDVYHSLGLSGVTEVQKIVKWLRGSDQAEEGLRSRKIDIKGNVGTWRLGDVVHSTPTAVSRPAEGYQFLYLDGSYSRFASRYNNRRHMIYFGGNDGMLHAVNGGFFNIGEKKFCRTSDCQNEDQGLPLGAEVWAYVPYNLWPHLKCLADPEYGHKYYVDQVPRIFDVQIFEEQTVCSTNLHDPGCIYPGGWGTILVGGMRFGGEETTVNGRTFTSAYFILDITNPEQPPRLLGEMTFTGTEADMGFTTSVPTMAPMVNRQDGTSEWYLVLGSGPTDLKGVSDQPGRVGVISLRELINTTPGDPFPFRIPADPPVAGGKQIGSFALSGHTNSFVSDLITVDFNFDYLADSVYFGTVAGDFNPEGGWDGGGKVYRLVTEKLDSSGKQVPSAPHEWAEPVPLIDVGEPVTAAPSAAWDGTNYWIYFGTGRLFNREDLKDQDSYSYFGIKEPVDCQNGGFTWDTVDFTVLDKNSFGTAGTSPGERGLLQVDEIEVLGDRYASTAQLICTDGTFDCLPEEVSTFSQLRSYIAGYDCQSGTDGWYRKFHDNGERNLGQATVLGGLLTFSTYLPSLDPCSPEGYSDLYALYYQTGTAWHRSVFSSFTDLDVGEPVEYRQRIGPGLAVTPSLHVGTDRGAKAFLQTSTGAIIGVEQPELPLNDYKTGRESWREIYRNILVIEETGEGE